jgi:hypothetical protein
MDPYQYTLPFSFFTFFFSLVSVLCCTWGHVTSSRSHHLVI